MRQWHPLLIILLSDIFRSCKANTAFNQIPLLSANAALSANKTVTRTLPVVLSVLFGSHKKSNEYDNTINLSAYGSAAQSRVECERTAGANYLFL